MRRFWVLALILICGALLGVVSYLLGGTVFTARSGGAETTAAGTVLAGATETQRAAASEAALSSGAQYLAEARAAFSAWEGSATVLVQQGEQLQANPQLLGDAAWQSNTANALSSFQQAVQQLRGLPAAPPGYEPLEAAITQLVGASDTLASDVNGLLGGNLTVALRMEGDVERGMAAHDAVQQALQAAPPG